MRQGLFLALLPLSTLLIGALACAQQAAVPASQTFDAASIRPSKLTTGCFSMLPPGGTQYAVTCITLRNLLEIAYQSSHIVGTGPALDAFYDLRATVPGDTPWTNESVAPMMQQFLIERFHLSVHSGTLQLPGYSLTLARSGTKLHPVQPDRAAQGTKAGEGSANFIMPGALQGRSMTAKGIASLLGAALRAPVSDHTDLEGAYDIDLHYAPDSMPNSKPGEGTESNLPSFFTAVEEQLGLKLQSQKITVDTVVIDHVDSEPTDN